MNKFGKKILGATLCGALTIGTIAGVGAKEKKDDFISLFRAENEETSEEAVEEVEKVEEVKSADVEVEAAKVFEDGEVKATLDVSDIVEEAMPSIVSITNKSVVEVQDYLRMFGYGNGTQTAEVESCGSGIIVGKNDTELLIVTNNHVVADNKELTVSFCDNEVCKATVKGTAEADDLAVISVSLDDLSADTLKAIRIIQVGDSEDLKVGQQVLAIGNALGYGQSVTTGIVSALHREADASGSHEQYIQTDAAINPGNSGGALLNMKGQLVGINCAKQASTDVEGMGYAIPVNHAAPIIETLMNRATRAKADPSVAGALGITGMTVDQSGIAYYDMPKGVYVAEISAGGGAEKAGLPKGAIITEFDGLSVSSIEGLREQVSYYEAGETVEVVYYIANEGGYEERTIEITLGKMADIEDDAEDNFLIESEPNEDADQGNDAEETPDEDQGSVTEPSQEELFEAFQDWLLGDGEDFWGGNDNSHGRY